MMTDEQENQNPMLAINELHYERVKNLGNYESERLAVTAHINAPEEAEIIFPLLRQWCIDQLNKPSNPNVSEPR